MTLFGSNSDFHYKKRNVIRVIVVHRNTKLLQYRTRNYYKTQKYYT